MAILATDVNRRITVTAVDQISGEQREEAESEQFLGVANRTIGQERAPLRLIWWKEGKRGIHFEAVLGMRREVT